VADALQVTARHVADYKADQVFHRLQRRQKAPIRRGSTCKLYTSPVHLF
jgi:hypothetical protein